MDSIFEESEKNKKEKGQEEMYNRKIVIGRQEAEFGVTLKNALENIGFEVNSTAEDDYELLDVITACEPVAVVLDYINDGMKLKNLTEQRANNTIFFVIYSRNDPGFESMDMTESFYYFSKPVDLKNLVEHISQAINPQEIISVEERIAEIICLIETPKRLKGCDYVHDAIKLIVEDSEKMKHITKGLYPEIARKNKTTASRVESAIKRVIKKAWELDANKLDSYFGDTMYIKGRIPTNGQFISMIFDKICLESKYFK